MAHPEAYSARVCSGQVLQSLGWLIIVVSVKVPACISRVPFAQDPHRLARDLYLPRLEKSFSAGGINRDFWRRGG
jgi:hypothetical protein